jgi:hypothetical protein
MLKRFRGLAIAALLTLAAAADAHAANVPFFNGPNSGINPLNQGDINAAISAVNSAVTPQSMATFSATRNFLDNGAMAVSQRGTGAIVGGVHTSGCTNITYVADRWCVDTNVTSGTGKGQIVTSGPTPPLGFQQSMNVWRNSGALTQPVCAIQEIPTSEAVQLQGQTVTLSFYAQALAGLNADNGNVINATIATGTGTDEGLGTFSTAPAVTPAFTGVATPLAAQAQTITTSWARYTMPAVVIPTTATELAVEICFTPTATGAGATDGFALVGVQLEQGNAASPFEFRPFAVELQKALRYYWTITEPAASVSIGPSGQGASTTTCVLSIPLPVQMRVAPTALFLGTALSGSTWTVTHVVTNTALSTPFLAATAGGSTVNELNLTATTGAALTAGQTCTLTGAGGGAILAASADF